MANIKSAKKRILTSQVRAERNKAARSEVKTYMKNVFAAVEAGDKEAATKALTVATAAIEKAANKGIFHKNNAAHKVSRLTKAVNTLNKSLGRKLIKIIPCHRQARDFLCISCRLWMQAAFHYV